MQGYNTSRIPFQKPEKRTKQSSLQHPPAIAKIAKQSLYRSGSVHEVVTSGIYDRKNETFGDRKQKSAAEDTWAKEAYARKSFAHIRGQDTESAAASGGQLGAPTPLIESRKLQSKKNRQTSETHHGVMPGGAHRAPNSRRAVCAEMKARVVIRSEVMQLDDLHALKALLPDNKIKNPGNEKQGLYQTSQGQPKLSQGAEIETFGQTLDGGNTARLPAFKNQMTLHKNRSAMDITAADS